MMVRGLGVGDGYASEIPSKIFLILTNHGLLLDVNQPSVSLDISMRELFNSCAVMYYSVDSASVVGKEFLHTF